MKSGNTCDTQQGMDIDTDTSVGATSVLATLKMIGAKNAKKLEAAANSSVVLSPNDATMYRALAA